jgi:hypothetical protein
MLVGAGYDRVTAKRLASKRKDVPAWIGDLERCRRELDRLIDQIGPGNKPSKVSEQEADEAARLISKRIRGVHEAAHDYLAQQHQGRPAARQETVPVRSLDGHQMLQNRLFHKGGAPEKQLAKAGFDRLPRQAAFGYVHAVDQARKVIHADPGCDAAGSDFMSPINEGTYLERKSKGWQDCGICAKSRKKTRP